MKNKGISKKGVSLFFINGFSLFFFWLMHHFKGLFSSL